MNSIANVIKLRNIAMASARLLLRESQRKRVGRKEINGCSKDTGRRDLIG